MTPAQLRRLAMALPETVEAPHFHYASFRVRGKIFATLAPDGGQLNLFLDDSGRDLALALQPGLVEKLLWGGRVVGIRLPLDKAKPALVADLLRQAWRRKAPKSLQSLA